MFLLIIKTIVVYPVLLFCGRIVVEQCLNNSNRSSKFLRIFLATVWVISSAAIAIFIPNIAIIINYLGSLANLFVFIMPGLCLYLMLFHEYQYELMIEQFNLFSNKYLVLVISIFFISYGLGVSAYSICLSITDHLRSSTD